MILIPIIGYWIEQNDELQEKISDLKLDQTNLTKNIATDFHNLLQKPENSHLNLRMLKNVIPEILKEQEKEQGVPDNVLKSPSLVSSQESGISTPS